MHVGKQLRTDHADRIKDAGLPVEDVLAGQKMKNLAVGRALNGACPFLGRTHILAVDLAHARTERDAIAGVKALDVRSADAHHTAFDVEP